MISLRQTEECKMQVRDVLQDLTSPLMLEVLRKYYRLSHNPWKVFMTVFSCSWCV